MAEALTDKVTPTWVLDLENRLQSRKQKLGHEIGAGAKCLLCKEGCPGLELHFWRKRCKNCKCSKEEHDVAEDDDLRFHILFTGRNNCAKYQALKSVLEVQVKDKIHKNAVLQQFADNIIGVVKPMKFDWVPPEASPLLAADYMNALPSNKMPITGSAGAKYRKVQLQKQIPMHDILPEQRKQFTVEEEDQFMKYLENLRETAGIGKILRVKQIQFVEESKACYTVTPQKSKIIKSDVSSGVYSAGTAKTDSFCELQQLTGGIRNINVNPNYNVTPASFMQACIRPQTFIETTPRTTMRTLPHSIPCSILRLPSSFKPVQFNFENQLDETKITGSPVDNFMDSFESTKSGEFFADNEETNDSIEIPGFSPTNDSIEIPGVSPLTQSPESDNKVEIGFVSRAHTSPGASTPIPHQNIDAVAPIITPSKTAQKIGYNLSNINPCPLNYHNQMVLSDKENANNLDETAPDPEEMNAEVHLEENKLKCIDCQGDIEFNTIAVFVEKAGPKAAWHPKCFVCKECKEMLVDLVYFYHKGFVYCARHYTEKLKIHRCFSCDELIFNKEYTCAEGQFYHLHHFCCISCDTELGGKQYVLNDLNDNHPTCLDCFEKCYAKVCLTCNQPVRAGQQGISFKDLGWHATPECFKCAYGGCHKSLLNQKFIVIKSTPFCSKACFNLLG